MSTRSQIAFYESPEAKLEEPEALLYRHSDGYPSGVLPDIMPFLEWWAQGRGISDIEYCSARLLQWLTNQYDKGSMDFNRDWIKKGLDTSGRLKQELAEAEKFTGTLGHGICKQFHGDIEYLYAIQPQGVVVFETKSGLWDDAQNISKYVKKLGTVPFVGWAEDKTYKKLTKE